MVMVSLPLQCKATNHGDGVIAIMNAHLPHQSERHFSYEEISAVTWKCLLQKAHLEMIDDLLRRVPEECIKHFVEE